MYKRKISDTQIVCLTLLWGVLCYLLLTANETIGFWEIFALAASAVIVFVPIYKNRRQFRE